MQPFLLAIETSTRTARVALVSMDGQVMSQASLTADRHAANLLNLCDQLFKATHTTPAQLAAIACGAGPGSFTGLRVGMAMGKGLALPFAAPFVLQSSLHVLALDLAHESNAPMGQTVVACLDAGKGEVHAQPFTCSAPGVVTSAAEPWRLAPSDLCERLRSAQPQFHALGGPELAKFPALSAASAVAPMRLLPDVPGPSAVHLARLAWTALANGHAVDLATAAPTYGRGPDITTPKRKTVGDANAS
ncbi:MAG: tRNA (adenosine(37)-N6)-threonylcarbamoyltransferase complex dimerization subunit type 1 TsaB [Deltaproteobacteria bacterium]|nr:tRNA (adenosine(37)-N6)-threonylcarbamoyltransferase complex dimerization subunit type 1 TsaB [Deltaproteobacteria bacterium]